MLRRALRMKRAWRKRRPVTRAFSNDGRTDNKAAASLEMAGLFGTTTKLNQRQHLASMMEHDKLSCAEL